MVLCLINSNLYNTDTIYKRRYVYLHNKICSNQIEIRMLLENYYDRQRLRFTDKNLGLSQAAQCQ